MFDILFPDSSASAQLLYTGVEVSCRGKRVKLRAITLILSNLHINMTIFQFYMSNYQDYCIFMKYNVKIRNFIW